jgi:hypothetical protein
MGGIAAKNALVAIGALVPLLALDYVSVRLGHNHNVAWLSWLGVPALLVAPVGFFWANWSLVGPSPNIKQLFALTVLAVLVGALWLFIVAFTVVGNFHMAIGGRL